MNYYQCSLDELRLEAQRRHLVSCGRHDQLSEALQKDDDRRGTVATTLITDQWSPYLTSDTNQKRTAEFGNTAPISLLVNESTHIRRAASDEFKMLTIHRNCVLVNEHILSHSPALLRIRSLLYN
jgi:hypothetical protein